jgi:hypothetical protein
MLYVACEVVSRTATVADKDEVAEVGWCDGAALRAHISYSLHGPVREYLDAHLR